jgi:hypothetical protein
VARSGKGEVLAADAGTVAAQWANGAGLQEQNPVEAYCRAPESAFSSTASVMIKNLQNQNYLKRIFLTRGWAAWKIPLQSSRNTFEAFG